MFAGPERHKNFISARLLGVESQARARRVMTRQHARRRDRVAERHALQGSDFRFNLLGRNRAEA